MTSINNFKKEQYIGTWYKYGIALKWYQPMINNVVLECDKDLNIKLDLSVLKTKHSLTGKLQILGHPTHVKLVIDQKVLFMTPMKELTVVDTLRTNNNKYLIVITEDKNLTILCNSLNVTSSDKELLTGIIKKFNFDEKDFKICVYD